MNKRNEMVVEKTLHEYDSNPGSFNANLLLVEEVAKQLERYPQFDLASRGGKLEFANDEVELGLRHEDAEVRAAFAALSGKTLTRQQIGRGLKDADCRVRAAIASRLEFSPTAAQIERGLTDRRQLVRGVYFHRFFSGLADAQRARAHGIGFNAFKVNSIDEHCTEVDPDHMFCPICKAMITFNDDTWCQHLVAMQSGAYGAIEEGPAFTQADEDWLVENDGVEEISKRAFARFCKERSLIPKRIAAEGRFGAMEVSAVCFRPE